MLASLVLMLIPAYRAHAAGVPAITSSLRTCYFFKNYDYTGGVVTCWQAPPPVNCAICQ